LEPCEVPTWQGFLLEGGMLDRYKKLRIELINAVEKLEAISQVRGSLKIVENLKEIREKLSQNQFHLVVLGQFKRGKSTFINSLIGDRILPTSVVPLTSIVTLLKYGDTERIEVIFEGGNRKQIMRNELVDYVTEKGNPVNTKKVRQVEVGFPSVYLRDGVIIADTPGVGSTFQNNTEMTYNYLPKVDAAFFLLAVDPPVSQSEILFLQDVKKYVDKIFFIQNKIDYLSDEERSESMAFSKKVIEEALGMDGIRIHPLSAKMALEGKRSQDEDMLVKSRLPEFDGVLGEFLLKAKGKTVLRSALNGTRRLLSDQELSIELERQAIATPLEVLEKKLQLFQEKMDTIRRDREDIRYYFEGEIQRLVDLLDRDLQILKERVIPQLSKELQGAAKGFEETGVADYAKILELNLHTSLMKNFDEWGIQEEERLNNEYGQVSKRYSQKANEIIDTIVKASAELFDLKLGRFESEEEIASDSSFYYMLGDPPKFFDLEGAFDFFSQRILPRKLSRAMILKDFLSTLPEKVDQNCGRLRWDFMDRMKRSFMTFRWNLNLKIDAIEQGIRTSIDKALDLKVKSVEETEKAEAAIQSFLVQIQSIKHEIGAIEENIFSL
jgi:GTP-binding protein EngB required for normal cell division